MLQNAMFMEKENSCSFFRFSFRATFNFPLWIPSMITLTFIAKKSMLIPNIPIFFLIRLYYNDFFENSCQRKIFGPSKFMKISLEICLFWFVGGSRLVIGAWRKTHHNKFSRIWKVWKIEITCFGNYFLKNGNIKCYSALNSGQLSITSFFLP